VAVAASADTIMIITTTDTTTTEEDYNNNGHQQQRRTKQDQQAHHHRLLRTFPRAESVATDITSRQKVAAVFRLNLLHLVTVVRSDRFNKKKEIHVYI